jgi:hypothetical protein
MPLPYRLIVDHKMQPDLGYFADLVRDDVVLRRFELYPYTVVKPGQNRPIDERRVELETARRAREIVRDPPPDRTGIMLGLRTLDVDGSEVEPLVLGLSFGIYRDVFRRISIQFPKQLLEEAEVLGVAAFAKTVRVLGPPTRSITLAMKPEVLPFFLGELAVDFAAPQDWDPRAVAQVTEAVRRYYSAPADLRVDAVAEPPDPKVVVSELRARATRAILRPIRDHRFSLRVRAAYDHRCAVCDVQLDLIEAAHIDPVEDPESNDDVANGMALCALHHLAYDTGLINIEASGAIAVNESRVEQLRDRLRVDGLDAFRKALRKNIRVPTVERQRPAPHFFARRTAYLSRGE